MFDPRKDEGWSFVLLLFSLFVISSSNRPLSSQGQCGPPLPTQLLREFWNCRFFFYPLQLSFILTYFSDSRALTESLILYSILWTSWLNKVSLIGKQILIPCSFHSYHTSYYFQEQTFSPVTETAYLCHAKTSVEL